MKTVVAAAIGFIAGMIVAAPAYNALALVLLWGWLIFGAHG